MTYKGYEDLNVWKLARDTAVEVIKVVGSVNDRRLKDQMRDAAFSIPSNIAEGYERKTAKDKIRFFGYSKGSASELKTQIEISGAAGLINENRSQEIIKSLTHINAMLARLIKYYESLEP